jgi:two-component system chemotaxis response regulator CheB
MRRTIRTLIVDDSAFVRKIVRQMLSCSPLIEVVGFASDGEEALERMEELAPDVVTCDLNMRGLGGVEFVRRQMARRPVPILILTSSPSDAEAVLEAMEAGAVDFIRKPSALANDDLLRIREELIGKVQAAAQAPLQNLRPAPAEPLPALAPAPPTKADVVVLGISTGGPQALRYLVPQLPAELPVPLLIVLHMPVGYTALFASKLNEMSRLKVTEVREGEVITAGTAYVAQAGRHLTLERSSSGDVVARLTLQPHDKPHRPSVDVLFQSAAEIYQARTLAIVMTGMGDDGKKGAAAIKGKGGRVLTEAESSCIIYGMPRTVDEAGLSDESIPLTGMARAIQRNL